MSKKCHLKPLYLWAFGYEASMNPPKSQPKSDPKTLIYHFWKHTITITDCLGPASYSHLSVIPNNIKQQAKKSLNH